MVALLAAFNVAGQEKAQKEKTGFSFGGFPIVAFDQDKGFQFGALANVYDFGKGGWYPNPRQQLYVEASWFTKGSQLYVISYDNRFLIPGVRFSFAAQFSNEKAFDFYGFNGYAAYYDASMPSAYYKMSRKYPYGKLDFTGRITDHFFWKFGYHFKYFILDEFQSDDLAGLPYGKSLYAWYKDLGFIEADEYNGGMTSAWRGGLMWDSRDVENAPSRGIWAEAFMEWAPKWMGTNKPYGHWYFVWRNYLPLSGERLVFAYRANIQGFIGKPAFYALPFEHVLGPGYDRDGFGGYRTIRGLMRNRIQGKTVCYFNTELRWRFLDLVVFNQNLTLGANAFFDGGRVLQQYTDVSVSSAVWSVPLAEGKIPAHLTQGGQERFHLAAGGGLRFILNKNFIIAVDYGRAFDRQDNGKGGSLYINTGYLF
jgi:hypothetical protein